MPKAGINADRVGQVLRYSPNPSRSVIGFGPLDSYTVYLDRGV